MIMLAGPAIWLAGCTAEPAAQNPPGTDRETAMPLTIPKTLEAHVATAVDLCARQAGADPADVQVVGAEAVTWPNGAVGCPEPGMMYTQALVAGYRIELQLRGKTYHYHGRRDDSPFYCASPKPAPGGG